MKDTKNKKKRIEISISPISMMIKMIIESIKKTNSNIKFA